MAAVIGTPYSPPSPPDTSSSATMSPVYPDRPIRPLPKRSLRARLSPEVAEQIPYPTAPASNGSIFNIPYADAMAQRNGQTIKSAIQEIDKALIEAQDDCGGECKDSYRFEGNGLESDDEDGLSMIRRYEEYQMRQGIIPMQGRTAAYGPSRSLEPMSQSIASSNESIDGYDSFENTNNKKKRKIPASGGLGSHHPSLSASLSNEMANMGISGSRDMGTSLDSPTDGVGQYYGSGNSAMPVPAPGTGISGAGRGRYGRSSRRDASGRSPLAVATGNSSTWNMGRLSGPRREYPPVGALGNKIPATAMESGIISAAIAEAAVLPATPPKGQENVSLLEQQSAKKPTVAKTQFTFTCESDSAKGMVWPGDPNFIPDTPHMSQVHNAQNGFSTQGTQTSPTMAGQQGQKNMTPNAGQPAQPARKPRRPPAKRYAMAARERRLQQEYNNYHHPPREDDIWICEFCEYESIFGTPPEALVRQYEIKDRRERKRLAEKRRLLEKAKMKGRKGKKGSKNSAKNIAASQSQHAASQQNHNQLSSESTPTQTHGAQSDEFYGDEYDDNSPVPALVPAASPVTSAMPTRIPRPIANNYGQSSPRVAHSSGSSGGGMG